VPFNGIADNALKDEPHVRGVGTEAGLTPCRPVSLWQKVWLRPQPLSPANARSWKYGRRSNA
jgi:hypothetical protein